ncbi:hypothetical protein COUCH_31155 [Couchioplanes caeruleus]|uniref:hypothetical protein n=1 Tax=Couchioplanes caeruleus TaxID=56438 RepID=UPI0020BD4AFC|nr:hypothetical protein [Couchioplanes caeruleus]UQU63435.1 hypothetical protein COUCH_31155 [Couchioplanes caeruleus]
MADGYWDRQNLPAIWDKLRHENACTGADRVLGWDSLTQEVRDQHSRLLKAKENLAAVWPPASNTSAQVFLRHMDGLATSMQQTLTRAEDTRAGLRGIIEALGAAQAKIQPLVEVRDNAANDIIPRWADHAEDEYDEKARQAMREAEAAIADHSTQIQPPSLFTLKANDQESSEVPIDDGSTTYAGGNGAASGHGAGSSSGSGVGHLQATPRPIEVPHTLPPDSGSGAVPPDIGSDPSPGGGPDLAGVIPLTPAPGTPPGAGVAGPLPGGTTLPGGGLPGAAVGGGGLIGLAPGMRAGAGSVGGTPAPLGGRAAPAARQPVSVRTAMPSGTVIGGNGAPGRTGGGAGRPGRTGGQPVVQPAANRGRKEPAGSETIGGSPDQPWEVLHGVAPVIEPDTRPADHNPGPGVIGLTR